MITVHTHTLKQNTITTNAFKELFKKQATIQESSKTVSPPQSKAKTITPVPTVPLISLLSLFSLPFHITCGWGTSAEIPHGTYTESSTRDIC